MKHLISRLTLLIIVVTAAVALLGNGAVAIAAPSTCPNASSSKGQVLQGISETGSDCSDKGVSSAVSEVVKILSYVVGAVAIIMVIVSGLKYITSGGDATKVSSAKTTLIYALIGVAIAVIAQILVHYVINSVVQGTQGST